MLSKIIAKIAVVALRSKRLSGEQKAFVTSALLDNLVAFPIRDVIQTDNTGTLLINGKSLTVEGAVAIRESAQALRNSFTRRVINEQITFRAINLGIHNGINTDAIIFSKAALWVIQEEEKLLSTFIDGTEIA